MYLTIGHAIAYGLALLATGFLLGILAKPFKDQALQRQYVDWTKIPYSYHFVAADKSGKVCAYHLIPDDKYAIETHMWCVNDKDFEYFSVPKTAIIGTLPPYRKSMRRRPK